LKKRILSGMRPTGKLHLGNLHGALINWVSLQDSNDYSCYFFIADWHALTSDYSDTSRIKEHTVDMLIDWLSVGLDPQKSTLFIQSSIKEHAELFLLLTVITPLAWLERNPTYKEIKSELVEKDLGTYGFLGYPVLQAADIIMYKAYGVPVGVDQLPHIELTREIVRRFNFLYGNVFPVPEALLTVVPKLLGIDGRKMSKSYDNAIFISDRGDQLSQKVRAMFTDPQRIKRKIPGRPDICNVFTFHGLYSSDTVLSEIEEACRTASIGCTECKANLSNKLASALDVYHDRQDYYRSHIDEVYSILMDGDAKARKVAQKTMGEVREALKV
jgi:tryptophanyl-tRNA synthetase